MILGLHPSSVFLPQTNRAHCYYKSPPFNTQSTMGNNIAPLQTAKESNKEEYCNYSQGPYWSERPEGESIIRYAAKGPASREIAPALTVNELMAMAAKKRPHKFALLQEPPELIALVNNKAPAPIPREKWRTWTWSEYYQDTRKAARALMALGFVQHDSCTIFGFNSPEWVISCMASMGAGGKANGVYPSDTPEQFQYKCEHSKSSIVCVESIDHLRMINTIIDRLPYVKAIVVWGAEPKEGEKCGSAKVMSWLQFLKLADSISETALDQRQSLIHPGHVCSLIYTSGTTGQPKAVMVTHDNLVFEARTVMFEGVSNVAAKDTDEERIISYLPLSHIAGQMLDIMSSVAITALRPGYCQVFFARSYDLKVGTLAERLRMVKPTVFLGVPRVWEKIAEKMKAIGEKVTGTKKKIATWAKAKGLAYQENMQMGGSGKRPSNYGLADSLVLKKVKAGLGLDEMKVALTGAAPITIDTLQYFGSLGIAINEVYGMSECTAATTWSSDEAHYWGSVGSELPSMEVKIFKINGKDKKECPRAKDLGGIQPEECQGEICFRGRHIMMGYMANADLGAEHVEEIRKKNLEAIDEEGWLHSGDMGVKSVTGMIKITGRYKELIITAGGENVAPVPIEDAVKKAAAGVISNIQMIGDKRKFNVALITLTCKGATGERCGTDELEGIAARMVPGVTTVAQACASAEFIKLLEKCVQAANRDGNVCPSNASKIGKFTILPFDFSVETGELTATLKLKRSVAEKKNLKAIDAMYEGEGGAMFVPFKQ